MSAFEQLFEVISTQRACRQFSDQPVDDAAIEALLRAATFAPSSENTQPWVFVVIRDAHRRAAAGALIAAIWNRFGREYTRARADDGLFNDVDAGLGQGGVAGAPVLIVVGGDSNLSDRSQLKASVFPAIQNLLLAAGALGLGTCLTTIATLDTDGARELVGLPAHIDPLALIPVGYPRRPLGPPRRDSFATKTHRETYGSGWAAV